MRLSFLSTTVLTAVVSLTAFGQSFSGAIYTSLFNGNAVNQNLYDQLTDVYLNGGPKNVNGGGLPNGRYYFQVVDPSGKDLLSSDKAVCRQLEVIGGYVKGVSPASVSASCAHVNGTANLVTGAIPVQLYPYSQTPNNGNEYKVELWQQNCSGGVLSISPDGNRVLGPSNCNKTDNFKVKLTSGCPEGQQCDDTSLAGFKYYDANVNGVYDVTNPVTEPGLSDFVFTATGLSNATSVSGNFSFTGVVPGTTYAVCELVPTATGQAGAYWSQTQPAGGGCYTAKGGDGTLLFGNVCLQTPTGGYTLGFWTNKNGQAKFALNPIVYLQGLNGLNLRMPNGDPLVLTESYPTGYNELKKWLANGTAVNMAYMLSVQMAATWLDVNSSSLSGDTVVLSPIFGPKKISDLILEADAILADENNKYIIGTMKSPMRQIEENYKNTFDDINNNRLPFVLGSGACGVSYPQ